MQHDELIRVAAPVKEFYKITEGDDQACRVIIGMKTQFLSSFKVFIEENMNMVMDQAENGYRSGLQTHVFLKPFRRCKAQLTLL